jgi:outer membrane protein OmpA-like peptidoglycan-associated protein
MPHVFETKSPSRRDTSTNVVSRNADGEAGTSLPLRASTDPSFAHDFSQIDVLPPTELALGADEPEYDFIYPGVCFVKIEADKTGIDIAALGSTELTDKDERKAAKAFAGSRDNRFPASWRMKPWMYRSIYSARWYLKFDRWGDFQLNGNTPLWCRNCLLHESVQVSAETLLSFYGNSLPGRRVPEVEYPAKQSEFVVFLLTDPNTKLTYTYAFWNENFEAKRAGRPTTVQGEFAYYTFERPQEFDAAWQEKNALAFLASMDSYRVGKPFTRESSLRPGSYEAYRIENDPIAILERDQKVVVPLAQAFGKPPAAEPNMYVAKLDPLFPPKSIVANFASNASEISALVDAPGFSKTAFFAQLRDVVMYLYYYPDVSAMIEGQTSRKGNDEKNKILSLARAEAVRTYILDHAKEWCGKALTATRIVAIGTGSAAAKAAGRAAEDDNVLDRRVVMSYSAKP